MTDIYHITHIANLAGIIEADGLWCDKLASERGNPKVSTAHMDIKTRRARRLVPVAAHGMLQDYVPFYFAPRSPMLYAIHTGFVEGYNEGQKPILHLASSVEFASSLKKPWCFTDGHAVMDYTLFFEDLGDLQQIDWVVMRSQYWNDTQEEPDRKRRRQAEFLVHEFFPWDAVRFIGVYNEVIKKEVAAVVGAARHQPEVQVKRAWYY